MIICEFMHEFMRAFGLLYHCISPLSIKCPESWRMTYFGNPQFCSTASLYKVKKTKWQREIYVDICRISFTVEKAAYMCNTNCENLNVNTAFVSLSAYQSKSHHSAHHCVINIHLCYCWKLCPLVVKKPIYIQPINMFNSYYCEGVSAFFS